MSDDITNLKIRMGKFEEKLGATNDTVGRIEKKLDKFIKCADDKFANRWTEKVLVWGGGIIGACILASLMALILK